MTERLDLAATMGVYAEEAVRMADEDFEIHLDYSEESLESVEAILDAIAAALPATREGGLDPLSPLWEWVDEMAVFWGAYLGEVILRYWGGSWTLHVPPDLKETTAIRVGHLQAYPISQTYQRLLQGEDFNIVAFYEELTWRLTHIEDFEMPTLGVAA